jgi:hypothetical protein
MLDMVELTDEQKTFLAGLLDAEGALQINNSGTIRIKLGMTEYYEIFKWLSQLFNNNKIYIIQQNNKKPIFEINLRGYTAYDLLLELKDYFIIKQDNAEILLKAYESKDYEFYKEILIPYTLKRGRINPMREFNIKIGKDLLSYYLHGAYVGDGSISFIKTRNKFQGNFTNKYYNVCKLFLEFCKFGCVSHKRKDNLWLWSWSGNGCYRRLLELGISKDLPYWLK